MKRSLVIAALALCTPIHAMAQAAMRGAEFQVNSYTTGGQGYPAVAMRPDGAFVVVWASTEQDGSSHGVFSRLYDSAGAPLGGELQVNTYTTSGQNGPAVALDTLGGFVIVWNSYGQDGSDWGVFGQRFDSAGTPLGGEFQVNSNTTGGQGVSSVAFDPSGSFLVVMNGFSQSGSPFGRRFDSTGGPQGGEFQITSYTTSGGYLPALAMNASGEFVVAWQRSGLGSYNNIFARRFDSAGGPLGGDFQVNASTTSYHDGTAAAMDPAGGVIISWYSYGLGAALSNVYLRRYDSTGAPLGGELQVNTHTGGYKAEPAIAMKAAGDFVVVWGSYGADGSVAGVVARDFDSAGAPLGAEFQINTYTTQFQGFPAVAVDSTGDFVVAWHSAYQDGSSNGIFGQRFCADTDADTLCNDEDILLSSPLQGAALDCSDPQFMRPEIEWAAGNYDRFRVFLGPDAGFSGGAKVTSGDSWLKTTTWTPPRKKWKSACNKALSADPNSPVMYIEVLGVDVDLPKRDSHRTTLSQIVQVDVQP